MRMTARKIESFAIDPGEGLMFAGNLAGQLLAVDVDSLEIVAEHQAHCGSIHAVAVHRRLPWVATLSTDRTVAVWEHAGGGRLRPLCRVPLREHPATNDEVEVPWVHSTSQALAFHDTAPRVVTRSANAGLLDVDLDGDGTYRVRSCVRLHRDADLITSRFVAGGDDVLTGSIDGEVVMSRQGEVLRRWQLGHAPIHWFEHLGGTSYLVATDSRFVARLDVAGTDEPVVGPVFTRDDLEHVCYNRVSQRAFVGSFDRRIHEVDPTTCEPLGSVFDAPFKCRWVRSLERSPSVLLVQCRNGGLYRVDLDRPTAVTELKETPHALWTAAPGPRDELLLAGDDPRRMFRLRSGDAPSSTASPLVLEPVAVDLRSDGYTKRMVAGADGRLVLGRTTGEVVTVEPDGSDPQTAAVLPGAVRDLALATASTYYVVCENGCCYEVDVAGGAFEEVFRSPAQQPLWALAYNPGTGRLAVGERSGSVHLLAPSGQTFPVLSTQAVRTKRMKWLDDATLLHNRSDELYAWDVSSSSSKCLVAHVGNTIEDFIWDEQLGYLVMISYMCEVTLCDLRTGEILSAVPDQMDYSKGLAWVGQRPGALSAYPGDFVTFGRSGTAHHFRIHDEKVVALGPVGVAAGGHADTAVTRGEHPARLALDDRPAYAGARPR